MEKRRKALQERRLAREQRIEDSLHLWEKEIVPNWKVVHKNPALRKLWWNGIPTKLRATMWERAVGNDLALSKGRDLQPRHILGLDTHAFILLDLVCNLSCTTSSWQTTTVPASPVPNAP